MLGNSLSSDGGCMDVAELIYLKIRAECKQTFWRHSDEIGLVLQPLRTNHALKRSKKRKTKWGQRRHRRWKHWLDSAKEKTCTPAVAAALTQTCQTLQLLSENRFFFPQVSQQGLILSTSNSDASCDESLMWENWKTIIWTWQFFVGWPIAPQFPLGALAVVLRLL